MIHGGVEVEMCGDGGGGSRDMVRVGAIHSRNNNTATTIFINVTILSSRHVVTNPP